MTRTRVVLTTSLLAFFSAAAVNFAAAAPIVNTDHMVLHHSTVPANSGHDVHLFVRERDGTQPGDPRRAVLMLHGRTIPALPGFDLNHEEYSWAEDLAKNGFDVFIMDLQGSGRSPRPQMDDPCNVNVTQLLLLMPNPLSVPCGPAYAFQLNNSQSDGDELGRVVEFIRNEAHGEDGVQKVRLVGWSAAAFQVGPYTIHNRDNVDSILFLAPAFRPLGLSNPPSSLPVPGFPMNIGTKTDFSNPWDNEQHCTDASQREDGIVDVVWKAIMENDVIGHHWGQPEGVMRLRNAVWWGWNTSVVQADMAVLGNAVPVLIVYGDQDKVATTPPLSITDLYDAIPGQKKLMFKVACTGHSMVWEKQYKTLHKISEQWLRNKRVEDRDSGSYFWPLNGAIRPLP